jgi:adenosylmethionine-8-amino-7-oxononanoate aminotransferase
MIIRPLGDVVVLMPPLTTTIEELDRMAAILYDAIKKATDSTGATSS